MGSSLDEVNEVFSIDLILPATEAEKNMFLGSRALLARKAGLTTIYEPIV
jgi:hypothetical protein